MKSGYSFSPAFVSAFALPRRQLPPSRSRSPPPSPFVQSPISERCSSLRARNCSFWLSVSSRAAKPPRFPFSCQKRPPASASSGPVMPRRTSPRRAVRNKRVIDSFLLSGEACSRSSSSSPLDRLSASWTAALRRAFYRAGNLRTPFHLPTWRNRMYAPLFYGSRGSSPTCDLGTRSVVRPPFTGRPQKK